MFLFPGEETEQCESKEGEQCESSKCEEQDLCPGTEFEQFVQDAVVGGGIYLDACDLPEVNHQVDGNIAIGNRIMAG